MSAVNKDIVAGHETSNVACKYGHPSCDLIKAPKPFHRDKSQHLFHTLHRDVIMDPREDVARTDAVHTDFILNILYRHRFGHVIDGGFGCRRTGETVIVENACRQNSLQRYASYSFANINNEPLFRLDFNHILLSIFGPIVQPQ